VQVKPTILMKTIAYFSKPIIILTVLFVTSCNQQGQFTLLDGRSRSLDDYHGQWVVVNFWAEWCSPCREEIPALNQLAREGKASGISVIGVSFDPLDNEELRKIVKSWEFEYDVMATDPVPILPFKLPAQLPTNYLLDPQGRIVQKLVGKQDKSSLEAAIDKAKAAMAQDPRAN
jgi:thiol-disulfide isomerase/thioredoxin